MMKTDSSDSSHFNDTEDKYCQIEKIHPVLKCRSEAARMRMIAEYTH